MPLPPPARVDLPAEPASVRQARRFVAGVLQEWHLPELSETAVLLTSELATNAVLHARTDYAVVVTREGDVVRVDVLDGSTVTPRVRVPSLTSGTGRGTGIIDSLSDSWGATPEEDLHGFLKGVTFRIS